MPYRVELAKQSRAGCKGTQCKKEKIKIDKGELRFGSLVTIDEHTSWAWKHWGCTTPAQIANLKEESGGDTDMVDGFDELPEELQAKVTDALEMGHVADEDWRGDVEMNRPGQKGMFKRTPKKQVKASEEDDEGAEEKPAPKKRRRPAKAADSDDEAPAPKKVRGKGKKAAAKEEDEQGEAEDAEPKPKKARGKKSVAKKETDKGNEAEEAEAPKTKPAKKKASAAGRDKPAPQKRARKKKAAAEDE
ncbi:zf-PARP-domain-containing protein [Zopfia rhizophila CBS 207.26]|uniref:Zf-PARP-domain-containing protein n=1 Tax=Zopfia rhizophila CBS 207.26 TaxID=1314779 RepID=A0A6A6EMP5_9PEZI|nr:zf-PARP-domain-containing protein [Zopfia rhizophila CBS 207.26]